MVIEAPKEFFVYTLVKCCDHIQAACTGLISTNKELKQSLDAAKKALSDLSIAYIYEIEQNITTTATLKAFIFYSMNKGYTLMDKVNDWFGSLATKNQPIYLL